MCPMLTGYMYLLHSRNEAVQCFFSALVFSALVGEESFGQKYSKLDRPEQAGFL